MAVTERGKICGWGWAHCGQCGHGSSGQRQVLPRIVDALTGARARNASAGDVHRLIVTEEGALYSFGRGKFGILGHGIVGDEHSPKMVDALRHVRIAASTAGGASSLALAEDATIFSRGQNNYGQSGLGQRGRGEALPQKVEAWSGLKVCAVAAGTNASCALTAAGELYKWGDRSCGMLGHGDIADQHAPKRGGPPR